MKVLVACEYSGVVREAFRARGHDAWSCDLLPADDGSPYHLQGDVLQYIDGGGWDLMIAHPPCTYLTVAGNRWLYNSDGTRNVERWENRRKALRFVRELMDAPIPRVCIENPVSVISSEIRKPDQCVQPYQFSHNASKKTCFWLRGLDPLPIDPEKFHPPEYHNERGLPRWANQSPSGANHLPPSEDRWKLRSVTYQGIADAMAEAWG